ncbi:ammonium transporter (Partial), partial [Ectocarpus siliculosus]
MDTPETSVADVAVAVDSLWVLLGASMVFFMQAGFAMLEAGSVSIKNTKNILIKNIGDSAMGAIGWWLFGNGLAFGKDSGGFLGTTGFALKDESMFGTTSGDFVSLSYANWIFQWAFAASATTIVSGAMAERATFGAYVLHSFLITSFIYPIVAHWAWSDGGWASARLADDDDLLFGCGVTDFAGSGVVHMTGGMAALMGIFILGPRVGRFNEDGSSNTMPQQSAVLQ